MILSTLPNTTLSTTYLVCRLALYKGSREVSVVLKRLSKPLNIQINRVANTWPSCCRKTFCRSPSQGRDISSLTSTRRRLHHSTIKPSRLPRLKETALSLGHRQTMNTQQSSTRVRAPDYNPCARSQAASRSQKRMTSLAQSSFGDGHAPTTASSEAPKSFTSNARTLDIRSGLTVATWNVLTLNRTGYVTALARTLRQRNISLAGITEARLTGSDSTQVEGSTVLHSGGQQHKNGVALVISPPLAANLTKWSALSYRLLLARFTHHHGHLSVIVTYAPTEDADCTLKDEAAVHAFHLMTSCSPLSINVNHLMSDESLAQRYNVEIKHRFAALSDLASEDVE